MKKIFIILLIAFIFLNDFALGAGLAEEWAKVKSNVSKAISWLKSKGLWTPIVNALNNQGKAAAKKVCVKKAPSSICDAIVNFIFNHK